MLQRFAQLAVGASRPGTAHVLEAIRPGRRRMEQCDLVGRDGQGPVAYRDDPRESLEVIGMKKLLCQPRVGRSQA